MKPYMMRRQPFETIGRPGPRLRPPLGCLPSRGARLHVTCAAPGEERRSSASSSTDRPSSSSSSSSSSNGTTELVASRVKLASPPSGGSQDEADAAQPLASSLPPAVQQTGWAAVPARYKIIGATSLSFVVCNLDKVVMSICIIPMAVDFGWSSSISGLVQSSFFWGYLLLQLPGGVLIKRIGGRKVLPFGVAGFSLATALLPLVANTIPGLCLSRAIVGAGESVAPSAATDMVARIIPTGERSRAVSFIFSGLHVGSVVGLLAAPALIAHFEWQAVFVAFGVAGLVWTAWFEQLLASLKKTDPSMMAALTSDVGFTAPTWSSAAPTVPAAPAAVPPIPWRAFLRSRSVRALMFTHFCNNWLHYTFMAWLPTFFTDTLSVDLMHAAQTALLPPLAAIAASAVAGPAADELIARGVPVALVRKAAQSVAFLAPTACLFATFSPEVADSTTLTVACVTGALGISSFSLAGLYCSHQDLSPRYASTLLGLTNTAGALPGIVGVTVVGYLFDATNSWELSLFLPSAILLMAGAGVYAIQGTHEPIDFDTEDNSAFSWEPRWPKWGG